MKTLFFIPFIFYFFLHCVNLTAQQESFVQEYLDKDGEEVGFGISWSRSKKKLSKSAFEVIDKNNLQYASSHEWLGYSCYQIPIKVPQNTRAVTVDLPAIDLSCDPDYTGNSKYFFIYFLSEIPINTFQEFKRTLKRKNNLYYEPFPTGKKHKKTVKNIPTTSATIYSTDNNSLGGKVLYFGYITTDNWREKSITYQVLRPTITFVQE